MYLEVKNFIKKFIAILTGIVLLMTFIDFLLKWKIYPYLFNSISVFVRMLYKFAFESFVLISLGFMALCLWKLHKKFISSKPNALEKELGDTKNIIETQIKKVSDFNTTQIKNMEARLDDRLFKVERTIVDFQIESYRNKGQVGEIAAMIEGLKMDIKRGWGAEDTLLEIKECINKNGMPNYFFNDLHLALKGVPEGFKILGDEILKLAQEKLFNPNK